jgi:hypothetical protein
VYELKVRDLEARFFGGVTSGNGRESQAGHGDDAEESGHAVAAMALNKVVGEGLVFKEDGFLTSANLCRWVIDFNTVQLGHNPPPHPRTQKDQKVSLLSLREWRAAQTGQYL